MNYLRGSTLIFATGFVGLNLLKPYVKEEWYSYVIHREIKNLVKEAIDTDCYVLYDIKSAMYPFPCENGWKLDINNKNFREAISLLKKNHDKVIVRIDNYRYNNKIGLKYNKSDKSVSVSFY